MVKFSKPILAMIAAAAAFGATPALAQDRYHGVFDDSNSHYLDYKTDISEAKRELAHDLNSVGDESDRIEAMAEYERELADAELDFMTEMAERGVVIPRGTVTVEPEIAALVIVPGM